MIERLLAWFDAPRFCPDDGEPIEVRTEKRYDRTTGAAHEKWYWCCPDVSREHNDGAITWSQRGVHRVHVHGAGRPRWDRRAKSVSA